MAGEARRKQLESRELESEFYYGLGREGAGGCPFSSSMLTHTLILATLLSIGSQCSWPPPKHLRQSKQHKHLPAVSLAGVHSLCTLDNACRSLAYLWSLLPQACHVFALLGLSPSPWTLQNTNPWTLLACDSNYFCHQFSAVLPFHGRRQCF